MRHKTVLRVHVLAAVFAMPATATPPTVGPEQRIDVNGGIWAANETSAVALDATVVGAWNDYRESLDPQTPRARMGVALSTDGGASWDDFLVRPPVAYQSDTEGDPMTAADPRTGAVWVGAIAFGFDGGLFVARKNPGQNVFQPSVMADPGSAKDKGWMVAGRNHLTADSTRVYITYNLGSISSDDFGNTWTSPVSLGAGVGYQPRIGPNGELYVSYWDPGTESFDLAHSFDGGHVFSFATIALRMDTWGAESFNSRFAGTFRVAPLPIIAVADTPGRVYAVWPDTTDMPGGQANVDVYFARSDDSGDSWTTPTILNGEGPFIGDQFFPWIEIDSTGRLHVVFLDSRHTDQDDGTVDGYFDAYYAYSEDEGDTWTEIRLTEQSWNSADDGLEFIEQQFIGDYLGMAVSGDHVFPVYLSTMEGDANTYTRKITFENCPLPAEIDGLRVGISEDEQELTFNWDNEDFVFSYQLYEDVTPDGDFDTVASGGFSGVPGITLPTPPGDRFYLIAGSNGCGVGPK